MYYISLCCFCIYYCELFQLFLIFLIIIYVFLFFKISCSGMESFNKSKQENVEKSLNFVKFRLVQFLSRYNIITIVIKNRFNGVKNIPVRVADWLHVFIGNHQLLLNPFRFSTKKKKEKKTCLYLRHFKTTIFKS